MAIVFPKKKSAQAEEKKPLKKVVKKVEADEEEEEASEEEETEEEADEEEEATEEEENTEESEEEEEANEEEEEEEDEEEEEAPKKPVKVAKKAAAPAKKASAPVKKVAGKKSLKTTSLSSFGQKQTAAKESWNFKLEIGDEEVEIAVPGKKPSEGGLLQKDQLMSIFAGAIKSATGNECSKKDAESLFSIFEGILLNVTETWTVNFMNSRLKHSTVKLREYPPLKSPYRVVFPEHDTVTYRRVCNGIKARPVKTDKKTGEAIKDKKGNYIFLDEE